MKKRDDLFDVDPPEEESADEGRGEDFFFEMNEDNSDTFPSLEATEDDDSNAADGEIPGKAKGGSRQQVLLLLLLVIILLGAGYFYLGDMLFGPEPAPTPKVVQGEPQKMKVPERKTIEREQAAVKEVVVPDMKVAGTPVASQSQEKSAVTEENQQAKSNEAGSVVPAADVQGTVAAGPDSAEPSAQEQSAVAEKAPTSPASDPSGGKKADVAAVKAPYVLQIGAYVLDSNLEQNLKAVRSLGYEPIVIEGQKTVAMTRLRVGAYPEKVAREKLGELKKLASSAFLLPEGAQMVLYAGSYYGLDRARVEADLLFQHEIHVDEEKVDVSLPIKTVRFGAFPDAGSAGEVAEKAQKAGLNTLVIKQG